MMKKFMVLSLIALGTSFAPRLAADEGNQLTKVTFNAPVEIPGQVLPAGTYQFKILDFNAPDVIQIMNSDGTKVYATVLAIPDYRLKPTGKSVINFAERPANSPEALRAWFYPGDSYGHEFVYPKPRATQLAKMTGESVPSMPANLEANTKSSGKSIEDPQIRELRNARINAQKPSGEEVESATVFPPPPKFEEKTRRSKNVGDLLDATNEARVAVEADNMKDAQFHINHAIENANMILNSSPHQRYAQLYDELDRYSVLGPIMTQRNSNNGQNSKSQASDASRVAAKTHPTVREVEGQYTSVALDVQAAKDHLNMASQALQNGNFQKADEALQAVQDSVVVTTVAADLPLLRARENLALARESALQGHFGETQAALNAASRALVDYADNSGPHANDARSMRSQIVNFNQSLQQNHTDAVSKIDQWWDQTTDWMTPGKETHS
jgi:flagellin-specific chaperone FliS